MIDMGQYLSAQDRDDLRRSRLAAPSFFTPDEEREVRAIRNDPILFENTPTSDALHQRLLDIKAAANKRSRP